MSKTPIPTTQTQVDAVYDILRERILSGALPNHGKLPSVRKLGDLIGYPRNAIWRALLALKEERYVATSPTGRYVVHPRFRMNSEGYRLLKIAFVGHGNLALVNPFLQRVYNSLAGNQDGFNIQIGLVLGTEADKRGIDDLEEYGAVILAASWSFPLYEPLRKKKKLVTALAAPLSYHLPCDVRIDNFHGGEIAGKAFRNTGITKAVLIGESQSFPNQWHEDFELRVLGFRKAWLQHGRLSQHVREHPLPEDLLSRMREIEKVVAAHDQFTGYFALSDATALMLLSALHDRGIRVPEEALIIGFDDSPEGADADPPLASLCPDPETMAEKLVLQLRTQDAEPDYKDIIYVRPRLMQRASLAHD